MSEVGAKQKPPPTVRQRRLAGELRALREKAGLTRDEVAMATDIDATTIYRIEFAKVRPQKRTLITLLNRYGVTDTDKRAELVSISKEAGQLGWLQAYENELPELYMTYISFESDARRVFNYESLYIPGLLQTESYARAVIRGTLPMATAEEVEHRVEARIKRQDALTKKDPLNLWVVLDEAALHREVGGRAVMAEQLARLAAASEEANITVQILPFGCGAHPGMTGSFVKMEFPDLADPALIHIDSMAGDLFLEKEADVRRYTALIEHLRAAALDPTESVRLVSQLAETINK